MSTKSRLYTLDPVTFEVLKNAFTNTVDQMAEQILRTCHSFVIFARDFSSSLCDVEGNTIMQGSQDIAVHVGTLHYTCKAVIEAFEGDIHPGDVFAINDPYLGGTHFNDVRIIRPIFVDGEVIAYAQSNGHWADVGGTVPGSFDINAKEHFGEGLRIPPIRIWDKGKYLGDIVRMFASNTRAPDMIIGDLQAQAEATRVAEREILRLVEKYGKPTIMTAFSEVQDYVEILTRRRIAEMPDGVWETEDYIDYDPSIGEGLIPIKVKMTIEGDQLSYDLSGSHPAVGTFLNAGFGSAFSGVIAGTKTFFPDVPLNSGFYRARAGRPRAGRLGRQRALADRGHGLLLRALREDHERDLRAVVEAHARARAGLLVQPRVPARRRPRRPPRGQAVLHVVRLDGRRLGRPQRPRRLQLHGADLRRRPRGAAARGPGAALPGRHDAARDPHRLRRAGAVPRRLRRREGRDADRRRAHGDVVLVRPRALDRVGHRGRAALAAARRLAQPGQRRRALPGRRLLQRADRGRATCSRARPRAAAATATRSSATRRASARTSPTATSRSSAPSRTTASSSARSTPTSRSTRSTSRPPRRARASIAAARRGWLEEDAESVAKRYRDGELDVLDLVRHYGVILDWGTGELLPKTTVTFRAMLQRRSASHWPAVAA